MKERVPTARAEAGPTGSVATRTEFAVDLGSATTVSGLRSLWLSLKAAQGPLLDGLRPLISVREGAKTGNTQLRLVIGPLANAAAAARLCAALTVSGLTCQTTIFDGQRLALK